MALGMTRRCLARAAIGVCFGATLHADPVPVIEVSIGGADSFATLRANVVAALGADARSERSLAQMIDARLGRPLPEGDPLAGSRAEVAAAVDLYYTRGPTGARRRLDAVIAALEIDRVVLESRPENLAAVLRALTMRARISLEAREAAEAVVLLTRVVQTDPGFAPELREFPPAVLAAHRAAREAFELRGPRAQIALDVPDVPGASCSSTLDGRSPALGSHVEWTAPEGPHRVVIRCANLASRVHLVALVGPRLSLRIDPRMDSVTQTQGAPRLVYSTAEEARANAPSDASALARSLDARRVVLLDSEGLRVIDASSARTLGTLPPSRAAEVNTLVAASRPEVSVPVPTPLATSVVTLDPGPGLLQPQTQAPSAAPTSLETARLQPDLRNLHAPPSRGSSSVGPWLLLGAGGLIAAAGAVFFVLGERELDEVRRLCGTSPDGALSCAPELYDEALGHQAMASIDTAVAITGLSLGGAAVASGLLWYALSRPSSGAPSASPNLRASVSPTSFSLALGSAF